ncbi:HNH endonuclease [Anaerosalibacter sp. Marseille-P3206]
MSDRISEYPKTINSVSNLLSLCFNLHILFIDLFVNSVAATTANN